MSKQTQTAAKASKPATPLAPISIETGLQVAKALASAAKTHKAADVRLMVQVISAVKLVGQPLTAKQWDTQIAKTLKEGLQRAVSEASAPSYASRFKVAGLAILSGEKTLQPVAGETLATFAARVREPLEGLKLKSGVPIYSTEPGAKKKGRKPGTPASNKKATPATPAPDTSAGDASRDEGGMNRSPAMAAALILMGGNEGLAKRLVVVCQSYREDFSKWTDGLLGGTPEGDVSTPQTAIAAAMSAAARAKVVDAKAAQTPPAKGDAKAA